MVTVLLKLPRTTLPEHDSIVCPQPHEPRSVLIYADHCECLGCAFSWRWKQRPIDPDDEQRLWERGHA
jgi:hypothetical protein